MSSGDELGSYNSLIAADMHLSAAKSGCLCKRRATSEAPQRACIQLAGHISCRIRAALGLGMAIACGWRLNRAAQARPRPMSASP